MPSAGRACMYTARPRHAEQATAALPLRAAGPARPSGPLTPPAAGSANMMPAVVRSARRARTGVAKYSVIF